MWHIAFEVAEEISTQEEKGLPGLDKSYGRPQNFVKGCEATQQHWDGNSIQVAGNALCQTS